MIVVSKGSDDDSANNANNHMLMNANCPYGSSGSSCRLLQPLHSGILCLDDGLDLIDKLGVRFLELQALLLDARGGVRRLRLFAKRRPGPT